MSSTHGTGRLHVLLSWPFLVALSVLLANDLYLKAAYSNALTGKLSDLSGVFLVALLLFAAFPKRAGATGILLAALFIFWKSPLSEPFIALVRSAGLGRFGRVVDYSDLAALAVIPLAAAVQQKRKHALAISPKVERALAIPILALSAFAVLGTTLPYYEHKYSIQRAEGAAAVDPKEVVKAIDEVAVSQGLKRKSGGPGSLTGEYSGTPVDLDYAVDESGSATFTVSGMNSSVFSVGTPEKKMEKLKKALIAKLGNSFSGMEFIMPLPETVRHPP